VLVVDGCVWGAFVFVGKRAAVFFFGVGVFYGGWLTRSAKISWIPP
jgi:hypothetical protein